MGWGDDLLNFAGNIGKGIVKTTDEVISIPGKIVSEYTDSKPHKSSYQGASGRHHDNETVIPNGGADYNDNERAVMLACRVVGGGFAGETLGMFTKLAGDVLTGPSLGDGIPNPTYHWCITVGDYLHQLQATSLDGGWNYYTNERINRITGGWTFYPVGKTRCNDIAIRDVSTQVMNDMPEIYNVFNNNCQTFSLRLVDRILTTARTRKYLMANMTYGLQKTPQIDLKSLPPMIVTRIDTGEVVDPSELATEIEPAAAAAAAVEETPAMEEARVEPVEEQPLIVGDAEEKEPEISEMPRADVLVDIAKIMIEHTPTMTKEDVFTTDETPIAPAAPMAVV